MDIELEDWHKKAVLQYIGDKLTYSKLHDLNIVDNPEYKKYRSICFEEYVNSLTDSELAEFKIRLMDEESSLIRKIDTIEKECEDKNIDELIVKKSMELSELKRKLENVKEMQNNNIF